MAAATLTLCFAPPAGASSRASVLRSYFALSERQWSRCTNSALLEQIELGLVIQKANTSRLLNLYQYGKNGETWCDPLKNTSLGNFIIGSPPSGYPSLSNFVSDAQTYLTTDTPTVLQACEKLANSPNSVAAVGNLLSAARTADADAQLVESEANKAANRVGIKKFKGLGFPIWGLKQK